MSRMRGKRDEALRAEDLQRMSWAKFLSRVTRGGRGQRLSLRRKPCIVKEKPFLQLDARRRDAAAMARLCLRLHRPFSGAAEDPMHLAEAEAVQQLQDFVCSSTCPRWLRKRYMKHNRQRPHRVAEDTRLSVRAGARAASDGCRRGACHRGRPRCVTWLAACRFGRPRTGRRAGHAHSSRRGDLPPRAAPLCQQARGLPLWAAPSRQGAQDKHAAAEQQDAQTEPRLAASGGLANSAERPHFAALVSCPEEMQWLAARHVLALDDASRRHALQRRAVPEGPPSAAQSAADASVSEGTGRALTLAAPNYPLSAKSS